MQTDEHRTGLLALYGPERLFQAERNFNAAQDLDVSIQEGDIVGVIKQQDPMGSQNRWLIDNGGKYVNYECSFNSCLFYVHCVTNVLDFWNNFCPLFLSPSHKGLCLQLLLKAL